MMNEEMKVPKHWEIKKLGEVCTTTSGGTPNRSKQKYYEGNIPWVKSGELDKGLILDTEEKISEEAIKNSSAKVFPKGTLLIALYGATIGKLAFLGVDAATNQAICGIFKNEDIQSNYLFHFLSYKKPSLIRQGIGGAQPNINQGILRNLEIPLPPLPEQKAIVARIEQLFSDMENGKQQLQTAQQQLKIYRQSLLKAAFEGKLTAAWRKRLNCDEDDSCEEHDSKKNSDIQNHVNQNNHINQSSDKGEMPKGWQTESLNKVARIVSGFAFKSTDFISNGIPVVKIANIGYSEFVLKDQQYLPKIFLESNPDFVIKSGDLLIALTRPITNNTTKTCCYPPNANVGLLNQRVACIKDCKVNKKYLFMYFQSSTFKEYIRSKFSETLQPNLSPKDLALVPTPICSLEEQHLIVSELESKLTICDKIAETITQSLAQAETLRQSILKKAFEGKLVDMSAEPVLKTDTKTKVAV